MFSQKNWIYFVSGISASLMMIVIACTKPAPSSKVFTEAEANAMAQKSKDLIAAGKTAEGQVVAKDAADYFARIGELLMIPEGIEYADRMFKRAINLVPNHSKANFYQSVTSIVLANRGFIPLYERLVTTEKESENIERARAQIEKYNLPEVTAFATQLPLGQRPLENYHDLQRFAREKLLPVIINSVNKLGRIDLSRESLKLNIQPEKLIPGHKKTVSFGSYNSSSCYQDSREGWKCTHYNNHWTYESQELRNEYHVDQHDLKVIKSGFMALADTIRLGTAYSLRDAENVIKRIKATDHIGRVTTRDFVMILRDNPEFLKLEGDQLLSELRASVQVALRNMLDLDAIQSELCYPNKRTEETSLITPICIMADQVAGLKLSLALLAGPTEVTLGKDLDNSDIKIVMDVTRVLESPIRDLKDLLPTSFNKKGEPIGFPDHTLGGLFPNGDLKEKLERLLNATVSRAVEGMSRDALRTVKKIEPHI